MLPLTPFLAALAWAGLDALRKHLSQHVAPRALAVALLVGQLPLFAVLVAIDGGSVHDSRYFLPGTLVAISNAAATTLFLRSVSIAPLSLTIPLLSLTPALSAVVALPLLGELPTPLAILGIVAVVGGALLLHWRRGGPRLRDHRRGALLMSCVALLWSISVALDKLALASADVSFHALYLSSVGAALLGALLLVRREGAELRALTSHLPAYLSALALLGVAILAQLVAFTITEVATVETLKRALGMICAVAFGRLFFAETITRRDLLVIALMIVGTALLIVGGDRPPNGQQDQVHSPVQ
jgi:drug/metabolite transporter (DMT)-like permease